MSAFDSVLSQKGVEIEYIVVDGGSDDGTVDIIREYAQRIPQLELQSSITFRWISERDAGMYDAINKGIKMATGDIVGILNADDRLADENVLATVVASFESQVDCIYGDIRFVRGESLKTVRYYSSRPWRRWMHYWGYMPAHPSVYVRKEVFERYGLYELDYDISADFEWMVRILCRKRIEARYLPHCLVTMRLGGKSTAGFRAMWKLNIENVRANRRNGYFCVLPMMLPKYLFKVLGYVFKKRS